MLGILLVTIGVLVYLFPYYIKTTWSSRDENNGPAVATCGYKGVWIIGTPFKTIIHKSCMMI